MLFFKSQFAQESLQQQQQQQQLGREGARMRGGIELPVTLFAGEIVEQVTKHPVVVIIGETGSGKTTQISQILYKAGLADSGAIAITQPRRVAAVTVARSASCNKISPPSVSRSKIAFDPSLMLCQSVPASLGMLPLLFLLYFVCLFVC
jgi:ABC-type uncharacterized transport system ATPase component